MFKDEILENERRRRIYAVIDANLGIHLRELQRVLDMPLTTLEYHLSYMTRRKIVYSETVGRHKRYYTRPLDPEDKKVLSILRQKRMREIVLIVLANKKTKYQFLLDHFKLPRSTLSFYLKYLVDNGILVRDKIGYENLYTVRDEERVAKILIAYKSSFLDTLVDKALNTWMEMQFRRENDKAQ
jgi:predicted transcriptional regulator